jgi:hypothetical protein
MANSVRGHGTRSATKPTARPSPCGCALNKVEVDNHFAGDRSLGAFGRQSRRSNPNAAVTLSLVPCKNLSKFHVRTRGGST